MKDIIKAIFFFVLALIFCGFDKFTEVIENIGLVSKMLFTTMLNNADLFGLTDFIKTNIIYIIVCVLCSVFGIVLYRNQKKKLLSIISFIVSLLSFTAMFS